MFSSPDSQAGGFGSESLAGGGREGRGTPGIPGVQTLLRALPPLRGQHVLHLSCGAGVLTQQLAARVGADGLVMAQGPVSQGTQATQDIPSGAFDHVVLEECPFHSRDPEAIFREIGRVLRSDGRLWIHHSLHLAGSVDGRPHAMAVRSALARAGLVMLAHREDTEGFFAQAIKVTN